MRRKRIPPKKFQIKSIKRLLKKQGLDPDLVDVEVHVDSKLTLSEIILIKQLLKKKGWNAYPIRLSHNSKDINTSFSSINI